MTIKVKYGIIILCTLTAIIGLYIKGPIPQDQDFHHFADHRTFWGIPNFCDVVSNIAFILVGLFAFSLLIEVRTDGWVKLAYGILFTGILLTGVGSIYYHWHPDNNTLVYDRGPMTIVFTSLLAISIAELISKKMGKVLLFPLVLFGIFSVEWWHYTELHGAGDLRLYLLAQFYSIFCILLIFCLFPSPTSRGRLILYAAIWYFFAKLFEHFDAQIFGITGFVSGHTIKHILSAIAIFQIVKRFQKKYRLYSS